MTRSARAGLCLLLLLAGAPPALAQRGSPGPADPRPLILHPPAAPAPRGPAVSPLTPEQLGRLRQAQAWSAVGLNERAIGALKTLRAEAPHQPMVLTELARVQIALGRFADAERLARAERTAQRDSLLLGHELSLALERLGRPRDAAQVAIEVWAAGEADASWASETVNRLAGADVRGVRDVVARAVQKRPERSDLARALARLEWRAGDIRAALRELGEAERSDPRTRLRWTFAEELLASRSGRDSTGALETLLDLAADVRLDPGYRAAATRRAWDLVAARGAEREFAPRLHKALADLPPARWSPDLRLAVARGLRLAGRTDDARALLAETGSREPAPEIALERGLADLRDGPPARALPGLRAAAEAAPALAFRYAEALFFAGEIDSAHAWYQRASSDPQRPLAGAALERLFLIEEASPREALPVFGRIAYEEWRGELKRATALSESLYRALPRGTAWAQAALTLASQREAASDHEGALEPLLALADSLPGDRLAPLARERAGDLYRGGLKDDAKAAAQWEECLTRYPRAWNAPEVRRKLEQLKRERRS
jgi:thioredoxin-like negative regulator of GroEL